MSYTALGAVYDRFTADVDYKSLAGYVSELLRRAGVGDGILLDLACGTGTLSFELARLGYDVIGADCSEEMLMQAQSKLYSGEFSGNPPQFILQDMRELDLFGTIRACVSTQDSLNHITDEGELAEVLRRVSLFTEPGGALVFDMNTKSKFEKMDGSAFVDEDSDALCLWRVAGKDGLYEYTVDVFERAKSAWRRSSEVFFERYYAPERVTELLRDAGFTEVEIFGERSFERPKEDEDRIFFLARK